MTGTDVKERDDDSVESGRRNVGGGRDIYGVSVVYEEGENELRFEDPVVDGRKILRAAGHEPPDEYVLIELTSPGSRSLGLDEDIDLREAGREIFHAFHSDRIFTFTVEERGYEWGTTQIDETIIRQIANVDAGNDLMLEREDEPDEVIRKGAIIDLSARGTEHIRIRKRPDTFEVTINYNGSKRPLKVTNSELIKSVLERAIALYGNLPNPHTLSLFTADRGELKDEWTVRAAGVTPQEEVLLRPSTVKAG